MKAPAHASIRAAGSWAGAAPQAASGVSTRITAEGTASASPTPEGRHRDGVRFVMMVLVRWENVGGGTTIL
ncbi:2OG-Fe dioxygenase family protein [Streptomyces sp. NPDC048196]|uniref:2OG-Fe dioxygenase family protein n=1 Tax=Streptomyces sp. NPDC048196 TaxID=3154712 RepID=UPI0033F0A859